MTHVRMHTTLNKAIAAEIRAELARQTLSQAQLARKLGWSQVTLSRRLRSVSDFSTRELDEICGALDVDITALMGAAAG